VSICNLGHDDRAVVVADYGLVSERVVYSVNVDGKITAELTAPPLPPIADTLLMLDARATRIWRVFYKGA
jgi:hypothetical protein